MANLLYIDTAASTATIAISGNGSLIAIRRHENAMEQAAVINVLIEAVLTEASYTWNMIDAVVVCAGPGSYTGLRVGMSTAKGLCYALDKPLILFNRLYLIALDFVGNKNITIALKARQGEYFAASFSGKMEVLQEARHYFEEALLQKMNEETGYTTVTDVPESFAGINTVILPRDYQVNMQQWIPVAESKFTHQQFDDVAYSEPFYLKAAYTTQSKK